MLKGWRRLEEKASADKQVEERRAELGQARLRKQAKEALKVLPMEQAALDAELLHKVRNKIYHFESDGAIHVWTDGSAENNQDKDRRALGFRARVYMYNAYVFSDHFPEFNRVFPVVVVG